MVTAHARNSRAERHSYHAAAATATHPLLVLVHCQRGRAVSEQVSDGLIVDLQVGDPDEEQPVGRLHVRAPKAGGESEAASGEQQRERATQGSEPD